MTRNYFCQLVPRSHSVEAVEALPGTLSNTIHFQKLIGVPPHLRTTTHIPFGKRRDADDNAARTLAAPSQYLLEYHKSRDRWFGGKHLRSNRLDRKLPYQ